MSALSEAADRITANADQQVALGQAVVGVLEGLRADLAKARESAGDAEAVIVALDAADARMDAAAADLEGVLNPAPDTTTPPAEGGSIDQNNPAQPPVAPAEPTV